METSALAGALFEAENPCEASEVHQVFAQPSPHIDWLIEMENFRGARNLRSVWCFSNPRTDVSLDVITAPCRGIVPSGTSSASRKGQKYRADKRGTDEIKTRWILTNGRLYDAVFACS